MKTIRIAGVAAVLFMAACNSGGNGNGEEDTTSTTVGPIENVNGNMPDTSNTVSLGSGDTSKPIDTTPH